MDSGSFLRWLVVSSVLSMGCGPADSDSSERVTQSGEAITSGTVDDADTAAVFIIAKLGTATGYCSGVVVSPHVVLTAAHCTTPDAKYSIYLGADYGDEAAKGAAENYVDVLEHHPHPKYSPAVNGNDVGLLITASPIPRTPVVLNHQPMTKDSISQPIRIVGYGQTSSDGKSFGRRHMGMTTIAAYDPQSLTVVGVPNICLVDSGGPTFMTQDGTDVVVGIHYLIDSTECDSKGYDMRVDVFTDFIDGYIESVEPPVVDAGAPVDGRAAPDSGPPADAELPADDSAPSVEEAPTSGCAIGPSGRPMSDAFFLALFAMALLRRRSGARSRRASATDAPSR